MQKKNTANWLFGLAMFLAISVVGSGAWATEDMAGMKMETKTSGSVQVELMTNPSPPKVGENQITVHLKDQATGRGLAKAAARIEVAMDASDKSMKMDMSHQAPTAVDLLPGDDPADYRAKIQFSDPGAWLVKLTFTVNGVESTQTFYLTVAQSGPNWLVIGGFLGAMALIVGVAAVLKRRGRGTVARRKS